MDNFDDLPKELQERMAQIRDALVQEMSTGSRDRTRVITDVAELKEDALITLRQTIKHSSNEALKAKVSMWAVDRMLEAQKVGDSDLENFLSGLESATSPS